MTTALLSQLYGEHIRPQKDDFWAYERLIGYPANRNPVSGTRLDWSLINPCVRFKCFAEGWSNTAVKLRASSLGAHYQVKMIINPNVPIVAMESTFFFQNLDDLMFYSNYSALVWTDDKAML